MQEAGLKTYQSTENGASIEDSPEQGDGSALIGLGRICHHDCSLCSPEQACAETNRAATKDNEGGVLVVIVTQKAASVNDVSQGAHRKRTLDTKTICHTAGEKANDGKGGIQGGVSEVSSLNVVLTRSTETTKGIEHSRTHKTDQRNKNQLKTRGGVVDTGLSATEFETLVHPVWAINGSLILVDRHCERRRARGGGHILRHPEDLHT